MIYNGSYELFLDDFMTRDCVVGNNGAHINFAYNMHDDDASCVFSFTCGARRVEKTTSQQCNEKNIVKNQANNIGT